MRTSQEMSEEMQGCKANLTGLLADHLREVKVAATAEAEYRKHKAKMWATSYTVAEIKLAEHRKAWVDAQSADLRFKRDMADSVSRSAAKAIEVELNIMDGLRSEMSNYRSEMGLSR